MKGITRSLFGLSAATLFAFAASSGARAEGEITFVSQGGAWQEAQTVAILDPAAEKLGITIHQDSAPDAWPMIKTMGETGRPTWDVVDTPTANCIRGGQQGLIEEIDFSQIPHAADLPDEYKTPYSVMYEFYSTVLAYQKSKFGEEGPQSWADFWDVEKFPGTRSLRNHPLGTLEIALLADGVPPDQLYPLDVDRAFKKLEEIKPHITVWWTSGGQSAQLLHDGEVDMIMAWNGRVAAVQAEGADVGFTFNQGLLQHTSLCILKNAPNLETALLFLNEAIAPEPQARMSMEIPYGAVNPKAYETGIVPPERLAILPSAPDNVKLQALVSDAWWASPEGEAAEQRWLAFIQQ